MMSTLTLGTVYGQISAWRADPSADQAVLGGVVLVQEIFGVNAHIRAVAERFADAGLVVIAPAVMDFVRVGVELAYNAEGIAIGREIMAEVGFDRCVAACAAASDVLRQQGLPAAVVGFCIGGTVALLCCTRLGLPAVSYYGGRSMAFRYERPQAPLLMHFGRHDPLIPAEHVEAQRRAFPTAQIEIHDAGHGFNCEQRADYNAVAADAAFAQTLQFLRCELGKGAN
jgi:carboxymethylenebutenolidase